jgi:Mn2+/Fe2+ NRAMP family transporter
LLAEPVLSASAAYAVTESFKWRNGLDLKALQAKEFYAIILLATVGGMLLNLTPIDPIKALFWSALINGVISVPIMAVMMLMARERRVMGNFTLSLRHTILGWMGVAVMLCAVIAMFATM